MNRLDTLALEAQVDKEQNKEFPFPMGEDDICIFILMNIPSMLYFFWKIENGTDIYISLFCLV